MTISERIKALRAERGWSQSELAQRAHMTQAGLSLIEAGGRQPTYRVMKAIARALGVTLADLDPELPRPLALSINPEPEAVAS